jgi:hypothetical protein
MTYTKHEVAQGIAAWFAILSAGIVAPFSLEFVGVINSIGYADLAEKQADIAPYLFGSLAVLVVAMAVLIGSYVAENRFWLRRSLADKLERLALAVRG